MLCISRLSFPYIALRRMLRQHDRVFRTGEQALSGVKSIGGVLVELGRYLAASPRSRIRRWQALRELDDRLLADVGLSRSDVRDQPMGPAACADAPPQHSHDGSARQEGKDECYQGDGDPRRDGGRHG
ncbi:DUF1127 domain-containing protein [Bradyrhizobium sp. ORS 111]|uniref:DUF1127 domain-containing protein n=1 Tax=Bradyrhizobium sp. ORS 111 TaxID=1685958 RepID=UPI00388CF260